MEYTVHLGKDTIEELKNAIHGEDGGGGSSEFSTANVTIVRGMTVGSTTEPLFLTNRIVWDGDYPYITDTYEAFVPRTYEILLYKGKNSIDYQDIESVSGEATLEEWGCIITGDCTITIKNEPK